MTDTIPIPRELRAQLMAELGFVLEPYGAAGPIVVEESLAGEVTRDATLAEAVLWKLVLEARRSALTQQAEPAKKAAPYGLCPLCYSPGIARERGINGNDRCTYGHTYPSRTALATPPSPSAEPAKCLTCSGHGLVGRPYEDGQPCPECNTPAQPSGEVLTRKPLTTAQMAAGREAIFSTNNPFCPCDSKTFRKVVEWTERQHGIGESATLAKIGAK